MRVTFAGRWLVGNARPLFGVGLVQFASNVIELMNHIGVIHTGEIISSGKDLHSKRPKIIPNIDNRRD